MFGLKGRDTFNDPVSSAGKIIESVRKWWLKIFNYLLLVMAIIVVGILGYFWYSYLYKDDVTIEESQKYVETKKKEVILNEKKFDNVNDAIDTRTNNFNEDRLEYRDIFYERIEVIIEDDIE